MKIWRMGRIWTSGNVTGGDGSQRRGEDGIPGGGNQVRRGRVVPRAFRESQVTYVTAVGIAVWTAGRDEREASQARGGGRHAGLQTRRPVSSEQGLQVLGKDSPAF